MSKKCLLKQLLPFIFLFWIGQGCEKSIPGEDQNLVGMWQLCAIKGGGIEWQNPGLSEYRLNLMRDGIYFLYNGDSTLCSGAYSRPADSLVHFFPQHCGFRVESNEVIKILTRDTLVITNTSNPVLSYMLIEKYFRIH